jgi:hypothetical protein
MREDKRQGYIWADAICINQIDASEKTEQVRLMADIYERAELVLVWLGKYEDNVRLGCNLMVELCGKFQELEPSYSGSLLDLASLALHEISPEAWLDLIDLLRRPWFWRAWVVQEYYLARGKLFQCGGLVMAPEYFFKIAEILGIYTELNHIAHAHYPNLRSIPYPSLVGAFFHFEGCSRGGSTLFDLLARNRGLQSYDKRDRVFALVGLSSDADPSLIDYGLEIQDVLIEVGKRSSEEDSKATSYQRPSTFSALPALIAV